MDPMEEGRLQVLRLPPPQLPRKAPPYAMLPLCSNGWSPALAAEGLSPHECCPDPERPLGLPYVDFGPLLQWARADLFVAVPQLHHALLQLVQVGHGAWGLGEA